MNTAPGVAPPAAPLPPEGEMLAAAFQLVVGQASLPMWIFDVETLRFVVVNDQAVANYGWSREEFLAMTVEAIRPAEDVARLRALVGSPPPWQQVTDGWRHLTRDGRLLHVEVYTHPVTWRGRPAVFVLALDVGERRHTAEALRGSEQLFRLLAEHATDLISLHDATGRFIYASPAAQVILGRSPTELIESDLWHMIHPEDVDRVRGSLERLVGGESQNDITFRAIHATGRLVWLETSGRPIPGAGEGDRARFITVSRDVSDRRRLEEQLLQSQKLEGIGRLAGGIAHDFNNILTAILGHVELAGLSLPEGVPAREDLDEIRRAAERATGLTRQLLAFARRQMIEPRSVDLSALISGMDLMLRRLLGAHIEIHARLAGDLWPVVADPTQLEQVLLNLALNARDAMPGGGRLAITTRNLRVADQAVPDPARSVPPGEYVELIVTDTGVGIEPDTIGHIFEPFFTTKDVGQGTGLGLSTTYGIVKQSGGFIYVTSAPGRGSTFTVLLPRAAPRSAEPPGTPLSEAAEGGRQTGGETILLVEDDAPLRRLAARALTRSGFRVLEAEDGEDALEVVAGHPGDIDLLLTDIVMPRLGGLALADQLRASRPGLRVLFVSGYSSEWTGGGRPLDEAALIQKPWTHDQLVGRVRERLDAPA